jgi:hypothetical protein
MGLKEWSQIFKLFLYFPRLGICDRDGSQSYGLWIQQLLAFCTKPIRLRHHSDYRSVPCLTFKQDTYLLHAYDSYKLYTAELAIYYSGVMFNFSYCGLYPVVAETAAFFSPTELPFFNNEEWQVFNPVMV